MSDSELADFEIERELNGLDHRRVYQARHRPCDVQVRLSVFSEEISQRPEFRRALKTDRAMLSLLQHQSIVRFLGSGEAEGALFFWTEPCESEPLSAALNSGRRFSTEDVIEIGWQICSALQQAHNRGLSHGGLSVETVLLSENLKITVIDFGVCRWLKATEQALDSASSGRALITVSSLVSRQEVEQDLSDLAAILSQLLSPSERGTEVDESRSATYVSLERLLARGSAAGNPAQRPVSAREFQGRLGEILIGADDDKMPLVDQRNTATTSKRSIVVELFDPTDSAVPHQRAPREAASSAWRKQILPIAVLVALLILFTLLAGWLF